MPAAYRASRESHLDTIERLERELAETRAVAESPRRRAAWLKATTAVSVVGAIVACFACAAAQAQVERLERHMADAADLLDERAHDLATWRELAQRARRDAQDCRDETAMTAGAAR
jgi:hypothetical protein